MCDTAHIQRHTQLVQMARFRFLIFWIFCFLLSFCFCSYACNVFVPLLTLKVFCLIFSGLKMKWFDVLFCFVFFFSSEFLGPLALCLPWNLENSWLFFLQIHILSTHTLFSSWDSHYTYIRLFDIDSNLNVLFFFPPHYLFPLCFSFSWLKYLSWLTNKFTDSFFYFVSCLMSHWRHFSNIFLCFSFLAFPFDSFSFYFCVNTNYVILHGLWSCMVFTFLLEPLAY